MKPCNFAGRRHIRRLRAADRLVEGYVPGTQGSLGAREDSRIVGAVADTTYRVGGPRRNADGTAR